MEFNNKARPRSKVDKKKKNGTYESANTVLEGRKLTFNTFKSAIFLLKLKKGKYSKYEVLGKYFKDYQLHK